MITKVAALSLLPVLLVGGVVMNSSVMIVDVDDGDTHIVVPVPVALAQLAIVFAPDEAKRVHVPELGAYLPWIDRFVEELRALPDATFVDVRDHADHVTVAKEGDFLLVNVDERSGSEVRVRVPLDCLDSIVAAYDADDGTLRTSRLVGALRAMPSGQLVHVLDGDDRVSVRMW